MNIRDILAFTRTERRRKGGARRIEERRSGKREVGEGEEEKKETEIRGGTEKERGHRGKSGEREASCGSFKSTMSKILLGLHVSYTYLV